MVSSFYRYHTRNIMLEVGTKAPDFTLLDQDGNEVSLKDFKGNKVVIYFYPKDSTPGCTKQACSYQSSLNNFIDKDTKVIGISKDSVKSHKNFSMKQGLTFTLLSDPELIAIKAYDVWKEKKLYGKVSMGVVRSSYLINEDGIIEKAYEKVKPDTNATDMLKNLD